MSDWFESPTFHYQWPYDSNGITPIYPGAHWETLLPDLEQGVLVPEHTSLFVDHPVSSAYVDTQTAEHGDTSQAPCDAEFAALRLIPTKDIHSRLWTQHDGEVVLSMEAEFKGAFFVKEDEVICYRRNAFHIQCRPLISALSGSRQCYVDWCAPHQAVQHFELQLSAVDSRDDKPVELTPKATLDRGDHVVFDVPVSLDEISEGKVIEWKRIMFKTATQNNGRRVELRQYFKLRTILNAVLVDGRRKTLAVLISRPITVRGRNPAFYDEKDRPTMLSHTSHNELENSALVIPHAESTSSMPAERLVELQVQAADPVDLNAPVSSGQPIQSSPETHSTCTSDSVSNRDDDRYEYVPISKAYWTPPVEIIYRPHAAHYRVKSKKKRYFREVEESDTL